ncbi:MULTISPECIES: type I DNA topoisomerase [unclassified Campylobacter]|uniref:type I DNA topoisomerase n=1 Tax=unclassified Campylobacter TaxID=2593542 RepID=UPI001237E104|nr:MULTISPECIES: type I DNA topoisomerase [unclassified Campylobacter]KAA6226126.1 type I DNA topoisomerase [Campylobacter sp. LR185c]KAA6228073.1 type I DNA topoisomerase [Campylobacter sp. LR286c]KAA6231538.1 type I DNA topoisomerase [Campylobacter sp. LR291e]KAA8604624.1 DNA topoisomerase I [Campylobacter sp. LR185c]
MKKGLIIVESPAKAKTIANFLGKDYDVVASKGHIRDLPKTSFGIKITDDAFVPEYKIVSDHSDIVKDLKKRALNAKEIYLATDEDREGEAIAYHIAKAIGKDENSLPRIVFHEITKTAIDNALKNPRKLNINSVNAQQTRRLLDRIVGYKLSPLLGQKIQRGLSAGRVQSAALKIIVDREKEIKAFVPLEYFSIDMIFNKDLDAELVEFDKQKIEKLSLTNKDRAKLILEHCKNSKFHIFNIESKERKIQAPPPFMTSTLQQSASNRLGFAPKKTMVIAQKLYEGVKTHQGVMGVITYMRTDSLNLAKEAVQGARNFIKETFGDKYLPSKANIYTTKSNSAQEAHEAIRVTNLSFTPKIAEQFLDKDELKLYSLIYNRFLACQMAPALSQTQNVFVKSDKAVFKISGRKILFDGYYRVYGDMDKDKILPILNINDELNIQDLKLSTHYTEAPPRYSEAGLVKKLESLGIGRPSTYAPTISILTNREYVTIDKKQLIPSEIAFNVIELLEKNFSDIVGSEFTAKLENTLDDIAENKADWQETLKDFYYPFMRKIEEGKTKIASQKTFVKIDERCPECGGELAIRKGRFGEFIACLSFPKCRYSRKLDNSNETNFSKKEAKKIGVACPLCKEGDIVERSSKRGKFYGCSRYPKCNFVSNYKPSDEKCEECGKNMIIKELKKGTFLECLTCKIKKQVNTLE